LVRDPAQASVSDAGGVPRRQLWTAAWRAWRDHPLLGLGPDNFRHAYGSYLGLVDPDDRLHANNFYLEVLATLGLGGVAAFAAVAVALGQLARRTLAAANSAARVMALGAAAGLAAFAVHGALDYFLEFTPTYALIWLLAGMLAAAAPRAPVAISAHSPAPAPGSRARKVRG
jgi:O-antigen ligase